MPHQPVLVTSVDEEKGFGSGHDELQALEPRQRRDGPKFVLQLADALLASGGLHFHLGSVL
jgi:hypothetical protein